MAIKYDEILKKAKPIADQVLKKSKELYDIAKPIAEKGFVFVKEGIAKVDWKQVTPATLLTWAAVKLQTRKEIKQNNEQHEETLGKIQVVVSDLYEQHVEDQREIQNLKQEIILDDEKEEI